MHDGGLLYQAFIFLMAAVFAVPLAKRLGLGSVLGYLLAGIAIGPFALGLVGQDVESIMHFAEFGVVMMLFLVGLELQPNLFIDNTTTPQSAGRLNFLNYIIYKKLDSYIIYKIFLSSR